jgi:recombinational DNA repair ATPase RecF
MSELPRWVSTLSCFLQRMPQLSEGEPSHQTKRSWTSWCSAGHHPWQELFSDFERVLKQRNSLLKSLRVRHPRVQIFPRLDTWSERFTAVAADDYRAPSRVPLREIISLESLPSTTTLRAAIEVAAHYTDQRATPSRVHTRVENQIIDRAIVRRLGEQCRPRRTRSRA